MTKDTYRVNWRYKSSLGGPWANGDEVDLDEATAIAINNDSPGVLTRVEGEGFSGDAPPADRQLKRAGGRRKVEQHGPPEPHQPPTQEPIDKTTFKAVK